VARRAISQARDARARRNEDDLLPLGGEVGFSRASQHYLAGSTLLEITGAEHDAITVACQPPYLGQGEPEASRRAAGLVLGRAAEGQVKPGR
jgi:hypothetical protein